MLISVYVAGLGLCVGKTKVCKYYDPVDNPNITEITERICMNETHMNLDKPNYCYALWQNTSEGIRVQKKGCWTGDNKCTGRTKCVSEKSEELLFCCCEGDRCNDILIHNPVAGTQPPPTGK